MTFRNGIQWKCLPCLMLFSIFFIPIIVKAEPLPDILGIQMDLTANTIFVTHNINGFTIENGIEGYEIRQSKNGPEF